MGAGSGKIVLDADASKVVSEAKRGGDAFKQAAHEAAGVGKQLEKYGDHLARTVIGASAVIRAIEAISNAVREYGKATADASKKAGATGVSAGLAGARLGLSGADTSALTGGASAKSADEVASFLATLAGTKGPGKQAVGRTDAFRATSLFKSGLFDSDEITEAIGKGDLAGLMKSAGKRRALLGSGVTDELDVRARENQAENYATSTTAANGGARRRLIDANLAEQKARNPVSGAALSAAYGAPLVGGLFESEAAGLVAFKLDQQTQIMRDQGNRPALAPSPDKQ